MGTVSDHRQRQTDRDMREREREREREKVELNKILLVACYDPFSAPR